MKRIAKPGQTVLLAGATGYIGAHVARELLDHDYRLLCPVRDPQSPGARALQEMPGAAQGLTVIPCDLADKDSAFSALSSYTADAICSCIASRTGGIKDSERVEFAANSHLLDWGLGSGLPAGGGHFTLLSAICVQKPKLAFQFAKLRFEQALAASGLQHSIVRPTAFFKSLSGQVNRVAAGKAFLVFGNGELTRCKPIGEADLAHYLRLTLEDPELQGVLPIGGPGPALSPLDQAKLLARLTQQPLRVRHVTPRLLSGIAKVLDVPGAVFSGIADKAEFARIGHYYGTESMLVWDLHAGRYDADATPTFGSVTLEDSYNAQLAGKQSQALGDHAIF